MDQELNAALQGLAERLRIELRQEIRAGNTQLREELRNEMRASNTLLREEMQAGERRFGVLVESLRGDIQLIAEGVLLLDQKFDRVAGAEDRTRGRVDGLELRVLALEQAERERRRPG